MRSDEDYERLRRELDEYRTRVEDLERSQQDEYEERHRVAKMDREALKSRMEEQLRSADSWPEALEKQEILFQREASYYPAGEGDGDTFFEDGALACKRAQELWKEIAWKHQAEIKRLENALTTERATIQLQVSLALEAESDRLGWKNIALAIRTQTPDEFLYW